MNIEPISILVLVLAAVAVLATLPVVWRATGELIRARQELDVSSDKMDQRIERLTVLHDALAKYSAVLDNKIELLTAKKLKENDREAHVVHSNVFTDEEKKEAYLRQSPDYRQLGDLSNLTGAHISMLRKMNWTLNRADDEDYATPDAKKWSLSDDKKVLFSSNDLTAVMVWAATESSLRNLTNKVK